MCGILHIVGSERDTALVLDDGRQRIALEGQVADTLVGSTWNRICVQGRRSAHLSIGAAYAIRVDRVRPVGDGHHAPIVGILRRSKRGDIGDIIETDDEKRLAVRFPSSASDASFIDIRIWLVGQWHHGKITITEMGPF